MIKNYVFDFGKVLARFYPDELTAPYVANGETLRIVSDVMFDRLYWSRLDEGTITDQEVKEQTSRRLTKEQWEQGCKAYDHWVHNLVPVTDMPQVVADLKKAGNGVYLVSNISKKFASEYKDVPWIKALFDQFDGLIFSSDYKICKPSTEIFEILLKKYALNPDECLFIDDLPDNIRGAQSAGMTGYLFDGDAQKLRDFIGI